MIIQSNIRDYKINIEQNYSFVDELKNDDNAFFVIDKNVYNLYKEILFQNIIEDRLFIIEALEVNKTIEMALQLCEEFTKLAAKRNAHLVSFGGGIIQDITGFVANILYRGIHWTFIPTTLLAACDSCIGGKTSLNYKNYKNLLGTFYPPEEIFICTDFFQTLTQKDFESGLGEVIKFNIMGGESGLISMEKEVSMLLERRKDVISVYLEKSLLFKKTFIEKDEFDRGERILLNFAHTFGHAFETISCYDIPHGTAVAMGMIAANRVSVNRKILAEDIAIRSEAILKRIIHIDLSNIVFTAEKIINAMRKDKKQINKELTAVLMHDNMMLKVYNDLKPDEIMDGVHAMLICLGV